MLIEIKRTRSEPWDISTYRGGRKRKNQQRRLKTVVGEVGEKWSVCFPRNEVQNVPESGSLCQILLRV